MKPFVWEAADVDRYLKNSKHAQMAYLKERVQSSNVDQSTKDITNIVTESMAMMALNGAPNLHFSYKITELKVALQQEAFIVQASGIELVPKEVQQKQVVRHASFMDDLMNCTVCTKENPALNCEAGRKSFLMVFTLLMKRCALLCVETDMVCVPMFPCVVNEPRLLTFLSPMMQQLLKSVAFIMPARTKDKSVDRIRLHGKGVRKVFKFGKKPELTVEGLYNPWILAPELLQDSEPEVFVDADITTLYLDPITLGIVARTLLFCAVKYGTLAIFPTLRLNTRFLAEYAEAGAVTPFELMMELVYSRMTGGELNPWVVCHTHSVNLKLSKAISSVSNARDAYNAKPIEPEEKGSPSAIDKPMVVSKTPDVRYTYTVKVKKNKSFDLLTVKDNELDKVDQAVRDAIKKHDRFTIV